MAKRYIKIPAPITLLNPATDEPIIDTRGEKVPPFTFTDFVKKVIFADVRWMHDFSGLNAREAVVSALSESPDIISLAEEDWKLLEDAVRTPICLVNGQRQPGYGGVITLAVIPQFMPFMKAILQATEKPLRAKSEVR